MNQTGKRHRHDLRAIARPAEPERPPDLSLAIQDYAHSTAPNRRNPDLVTQRLIRAALAGRPAPYGRDDLEELARHCRERKGS